jgi:hypothetical protein
MTHAKSAGQLASPGLQTSEVQWKSPAQVWPSAQSLAGLDSRLHRDGWVDSACFEAGQTTRRLVRNYLVQVGACSVAVARLQLPWLLHVSDWAQSASVAGAHSRRPLPSTNTSHPPRVVQNCDVLQSLATAGSHTPHAPELQSPARNEHNPLILHSALALHATVDWGPGQSLAQPSLEQAARDAPTARDQARKVMDFMVTPARLAAIMAVRWRSPACAQPTSRLARPSTSSSTTARARKKSKPPSPIVPATAGRAEPASSPPEAPPSSTSTVYAPAPTSARPTFSPKPQGLPAQRGVTAPDLHDLAGLPLATPPSPRPAARRADPTAPARLT